MTWTRILATIMHTFPGTSWRELTRELTFFQVIALYDRATEIITGEYEDDPDEAVEDDKFTYNEERGRWE